MYNLCGKTVQFKRTNCSTFTDKVFLANGIITGIGNAGSKIPGSRLKYWPQCPLTRCVSGLYRYFIDPFIRKVKKALYLSLDLTNQKTGF